MRNFLALALLPFVAQVAWAQSWPHQNVHLIVPATPGSSLDVIARVIGERLQTRWKQAVVIEDKAGAGGMVGMSAVAKAAADGYSGSDAQGFW